PGAGYTFRAGPLNRAGDGEREPLLFLLRARFPGGRSGDVEAAVRRLEGHVPGGRRDGRGRASQPPRRLARGADRHRRRCRAAAGAAHARSADRGGARRAAGTGGVRRRRTTAVVVAAVLAAAAHVTAARAEYPERAVRIVVPVAAGGGVDVMARLIAQQLSERFGQQFVVENRAGAAGVIGSKTVIAAPADGYTLLYTPSRLALAGAGNKVAPYDVSKDLSPIVNVAVSPYALVVHASVPATTVAELIAYAKANPGALSYSSAGVGSASHLAAELFKSMAGIEMVHVPNKG